MIIAMLEDHSTQAYVALALALALASKTMHAAYDSRRCSPFIKSDDATDFATSSWTLTSMRVFCLQQNVLKGSPVPCPVCDQPDNDRCRVVHYPVSDVVDPDLDLAAASGVVH